MEEESTVSTTAVESFEPDYGPDENEDFVTTLPYEMETKSAIVPTTSNEIVSTSFEPTVAGVSFQTYFDEDTYLIEGTDETKIRGALVPGGQLVGDHVNLTVISGDINNLTYKSKIIVNGLRVGGVDMGTCVFERQNTLYRKLQAYRLESIADGMLKRPLVKNSEWGTTDWWLCLKSVKAVNIVADRLSGPSRAGSFLDLRPTFRRYTNNDYMTQGQLLRMTRDMAGMGGPASFTKGLLDKYGEWHTNPAGRVHRIPCRKWGPLYEEVRKFATGI